jgi:hypothetical protein
MLYFKKVIVKQHANATTPTVSAGNLLNAVPSHGRSGSDCHGWKAQMYYDLQNKLVFVLLKRECSAKRQSKLQMPLVDLFSLRTWTSVNCFEPRFKIEHSTE